MNGLFLRMRPALALGLLINLTPLAQAGGKNADFLSAQHCALNLSGLWMQRVYETSQSIRKHIFKNIDQGHSNKHTPQFLLPPEKIEAQMPGPFRGLSLYPQEAEQLLQNIEIATGRSFSEIHRKGFLKFATNEQTLSPLELVLLVNLGMTTKHAIQAFHEPITLQRHSIISGCTQRLDPSQWTSTIETLENLIIGMLVHENRLQDVEKLLQISIDKKKRIPNTRSLIEPTLRFLVQREMAQQNNLSFAYSINGRALADIALEDLRPFIPSLKQWHPRLPMTLGEWMEWSNNHMAEQIHKNSTWLHEQKTLQKRLFSNWIRQTGYGISPRNLSRKTFNLAFYEHHLRVSFKNSRPWLKKMIDGEPLSPEEQAEASTRRRHGEMELKFAFTLIARKEFSLSQQQIHDFQYLTWKTPEAMSDILKTYFQSHDISLPEIEPWVLQEHMELITSALANEDQGEECLRRLILPKAHVARTELLNLPQKPEKKRPKASVNITSNFYIYAAVDIWLLFRMYFASPLPEKLSGRGTQLFEEAGEPYAYPLKIDYIDAQSGDTALDRLVFREVIRQRRWLPIRRLLQLQQDLVRESTHSLLMSEGFSAMAIHHISHKAARARSTWLEQVAWALITLGGDDPRKEGWAALEGFYRDLLHFTPQESFSDDTIAFLKEWDKNPSTSHKARAIHTQANTLRNEARLVLRQQSQNNPLGAIRAMVNFLNDIPNRAEITSETKEALQYEILNQLAYLTIQIKNSFPFKRLFIQGLLKDCSWPIYLTTFLYVTYNDTSLLEEILIHLGSSKKLPQPYKHLLKTIDEKIFTQAVRAIIHVMDHRSEEEKTKLQTSLVRWIGLRPDSAPIIGRFLSRIMHTHQSKSPHLIPSWLSDLSDAIARINNEKTSSQSRPRKHRRRTKQSA